MKQKDVALLVVIAVVGVVVSLFVSNMIFASPKNREQSVEVVQPITADFPQPSSKYFNKTSIDPTNVISVGQNANPNPFNGNSAQ